MFIMLDFNIKVSAQSMINSLFQYLMGNQDMDWQHSFLFSVFSVGYCQHSLLPINQGIWPRVETCTTYHYATLDHQAQKIALKPQELEIVTTIRSQ